ARSVVALDPQQPANTYLRAEFNIEDGLPATQENPIFKRRNGFLWVATAAGLARFDGGRFTPIRFHAGNLREVAVNTLLTTPDGEMWVGTDAGLVRIPPEALNHFDRSLVQTYHAGVGFSDQVMTLHLSRNGVIWVGTNRGLYRMDQGKMLAVIPGEDI